MKLTITFSLALSSLITCAQTSTDSSKLTQTKNLTTVRVTSKKPFVEQQIDKTVVNVQADINTTGSSAFEILQKAPGLSITGDDVINMSGKAGVNVLVDGRSLQMSNRELANYLRALPGSAIDKIEIISNPSARFDAQGNAGIINIRLKKNKIKGTNGNVTGGYTQNTHYRSNIGFNINHRQGKINVFANAGADNNLQHTTGDINRNVLVNGSNKKFLTSTIDKDRNKSYSIRTGIDVYAGKKTTWGILFNTNSNRSPFTTPGTTFISSNGMIDSSLQTSNDNLYNNRRYNTNLNYSYQDTVGNELNADADYTYFKNSNSTRLATSYLDENFSKYNFSANTLDVATSIKIYAFKADYRKQFKKINVKLETGVKASTVITENNLFATVLNGNAVKADTGRSNIFNYKENVYAAYINVGGQIKKFEYQIGLRTEYALIKGSSVDLKNTFISNPDTNYFNFFPSAFISYKANEKNMFALSISKRINRPDYQTLNPFETIYDIYTSEKGNPYLRPQYSTNMELKYTYRYAMSAAIGFNHTKDYSQTISRQRGELTTATNDNIGTLDNAYLNISSPLPINKWWNGYVNITGFLNKYKGMLPDGKLDVQVTGMNFYIQNNFTAGKGWEFQLSNWYNAGTTEAIFKTSWLGSVDAGIKKSILNNKASVRLTVLDMFNTQRWQQQVQFANQDFTYRRKWESRGIRLQLSWSFGKSKYQARERETNQEDNRIKVKS